MSTVADPEDSDDSGELRIAVSVLTQRVETLEDRADSMERRFEKYAEDRKDSSEGLKIRLGMHEVDDASLFATLKTKLEMNNVMTATIQKRSAWTVGLLWTIFGGLVLAGLVKWLVS